jgi:hypothetical protein
MESGSIRRSSFSRGAAASPGQDGLLVVRRRSECPIRLARRLRGLRGIKVIAYPDRLAISQLPHRADSQFDRRATCLPGRSLVRKGDNVVFACVDAFELDYQSKFSN